MPLLCKAEESTLLIIDPQERLMPAIDGGQEVVRRCVQLASAARTLGIPVIGTEQNPAGLGPNIEALRSLCSVTVAKLHFSAAAEPGFLSHLPDLRRTVVVAGCEAHVCVLQTVVGLIQSGYDVKWVDDAVGSRHPHDRVAAGARARAFGADVVTTEMVIFEWLATSAHPSFRPVSRLIR